MIAAPPGPLVVIAGAGAGKTETMAARVVWLVANGYARPGQVLGLTFTRKAAGQLLRRVRVPAGPAGRRRHRRRRRWTRPTTRQRSAPTTRSPGTLLREHGLLLPVEPDTRLLSETELWQLAFRRGQRASRRAATPTRHPPPSPRWCCGWPVSWPSTSSTPTSCATPTSSWSGWCTRCPPGPYQRDRGPSQWLLRMLATQTERTALVPLIDALHARMRAEKVMDFGMQMAAAARLASTFPQVGEQLRRRYRVVLLDEYQDTGHAQRVALSSLFGGGVDDDLALTAVGDPIQSIYGWRGASATNLPRFTTDFPARRRQPRRRRWSCAPAGATRRGRCTWPTRCRPRPGAGRWRCGRCGRGPGAEPGTIRCALLTDVAAERDWVADHVAAALPRRPATRGRPCRRRRCWCAATPTPRRWPMR